MSRAVVVNAEAVKARLVSLGVWPNSFYQLAGKVRSESKAYRMIMEAMPSNGMYLCDYCGKVRYISVLGNDITKYEKQEIKRNVALGLKSGTVITAKNIVEWKVYPHRFGGKH